MKNLLMLIVLHILWYSIDANTFTNPIVDHGPDPWMEYYNGYYYLTYSTFSNKIVMRKAKRLSEFHSSTETTIFTLSNSTGCCVMWAPEFHLLNGTNGQRWYLYYAAGKDVKDYIPEQRIHVLESAGTDPMGPYTFKADMRDPNDDKSLEIDASILQVGGKLYLMGSYVPDKASLFIRPLSNPWTASGPKVRISTPTLSWETQGAAINEGPEPLYHNGKTMIVYSASYCNTPDYKLGLLTLTGSDPLNPKDWTKSGPVFQRNDTIHVYAPGHNGFFMSPDGKENWIVYHANSDTKSHCGTDRSARAQKFTFNSDGTPNFGTPVALGTSITSPSGEPEA